MTTAQEKKIKGFLKNNPDSTKTSIAKRTKIWLSTVCSIVDDLEERKEVKVYRVTKRVHLVTLREE